MVQYKTSVWCSLGALVEAAGNSVIAAIYELLYLFQTIFTAFALPQLVTSITLPTFSDTLKDLEVALCDVTAVFAALLPVTFSCSAQTNGADLLPDTALPTPPVVPPEAFNWPVELATVNERQSLTICTFNATQWADAGVNATTSCNCSAAVFTTDTYAELLVNQGPACFLQCIDTLYPYPVRIVGAPQTPLVANCFACDPQQIIFTSATTLRNFLTSTTLPLNGPLVFPSVIGTGFLPFQAVDPLPNVPPTANGWTVELIAGVLNDRVQNTYSTRQPSYAPTATCLNSVEMPLLNYPEYYNDTIALFTPGTGFFIMDYIPMLSIYIFGGLTFTNAYTDLNVIDAIFPDPSTTKDQVLLIRSLALGVFATGNLTVISDFYRTLIAPVRQFNTLVSGGGCSTDALKTGSLNSTYGECWKECRQAQTSGPLIAPANSNFTQNLTSSNPLYCTYTPDQWGAANTSVCDCSLPDMFYALGDPVCLRICDPPSYPLLVGAVRAACLVPGACDAVGQNFLDDTALTTALNAPVSGLDNYLTNVACTLQNQTTPEFFRSYLTAFLNVYYMRRYNPDRLLYFRTLDDPLFDRTCIANDTYRSLWSGVNVELFLLVVNATYFGDASLLNNTCAATYRLNSAEWNACQLLLAAYPNRVGTAWGAQMREGIRPILDLLQLFHPNCTTPSTFRCFVFSTYQTSQIGTSLPGSIFVPGPEFLPALQFTVAQWDVLPPTELDNITICGSTIKCYANTGCAVGRFLIVPFQIVSAVINQLNAVISGGSGQWTLGNTFFDIVKTVLILLVQRSLGAALSLLNSIDCTMCAIVGNRVGQTLCKSPLYKLFQRIFALVQALATLIIGFAVDTLNFILFFFYYLFGADFAALVAHLFWYLGVVLSLFIKLPEILFAFILGSVCLCKPFLTLFGWPPGCRNAGICNTKKRALAADSVFGGELGYQIFAADWPANPYGWPAPGDWCAARMPVLASRVVGGLSENEQEETMYCLSRAVLLPRISSAAPLAGGQVDSCARVLKGMDAQPTRAFIDFDVATQALALECIGKYGLVYAAKQHTADGVADWMPDHALATLDNPLVSWMPMAISGVQGLTAQTERTRDGTYGPEILASDEYLGRLQQVYGSARVALARRTLHDGTPPPLSDYVAALYPTIATSKRAAVPSTTQAQILGGSQLAETLKQNVATELWPAVLRSFDEQLASLPPVLALAANGEPTVTTAAQLKAGATAAFTSDAAFAQHGRVVAARGLHSLYQAGRLVLNGPRTPLFGHPLAKRAMTEAASTATVALPGQTITLLANGIKGLVQTLNEIRTGAAHANATGVPGAVTVVQWQLVKDRAGARTDAIYTLAARLPPPRLGISSADEDPALAAARQAFPQQPVEQTFAERFWGTATQQRWSNAREALAALQLRWLQALGDTSTRLGQRAVKFAAVRATVIAATASVMHWGTVASLPPFNCSNSTFCQQCLLFTTYLERWLNIVNITVEFYDGTAPRNESTFAYLAYDWSNLDVRLRNNFSQPFWGNSSLNNLPFPPLYYSWWAFVGDTLPNKTGFSDIQPLINQTVNFFVALLEGINWLDPGGAAVHRRAPRVPASFPRPAPLPKNMQFDLDRSVLRLLPIGSVARTLTAMGIEANRTAVAELRAAASDESTWAQLYDLGVQWFNFLLALFVTCEIRPEFDGSGVRFSVGETAVGVFFLFLGVLALAIAFPSIMLFLFGFGGLIFVLVILWISLSVSVSWSQFCSPALPPILFTTMVPHFLTDVLLPECMFWLSALVLESNYDKATCNDCAAWQNDTWHVGNCGTDYGWTMLDVPVFLLKQWAPALLAMLQNPGALPFPLSFVLSSPTIQTYLRRWDHVNMTTDPRAYAVHWTCAIGIELVPFIIGAFALAVLALFEPTRMFGRALLAGIAWLIATGAFLLYSFFFGFIVTFVAAPEKLASLQAVELAA